MAPVPATRNRKMAFTNALLVAALRKGLRNAFPMEAFIPALRFAGKIANHVLLVCVAEYIKSAMTSNHSLHGSAELL